MSLIPIDEDFNFEEDGHRYVLASGEVRPSITQIMKSAGIYDFSMVKPHVLENARRRGTNVHRWCAEYDVYGSIDDTWMADDEVGYVNAWIKFKRDSKLVVRKVETPMLRMINGILVGGTPDVEGFIGRLPFVVERKACAAKHPGWSIQTALQEMLITGKPRVGHMGRMSVQLKANGNYSTAVYDDPTDAVVANAVVTLSEFPLDVESEITLDSWMHNNGLKKAA